MECEVEVRGNRWWKAQALDSFWNGRMKGHHYSKLSLYQRNIQEKQTREILTFFTLLFLARYIVAYELDHQHSNALICHTTMGQLPSISNVKFIAPFHSWFCIWKKGKATICYNGTTPFHIQCCIKSNLKWKWHIKVSRADWWR